LSDSRQPEKQADIDEGARLMLRVKEDDAEAYQILMIQYQPRLQRLLRQLVDSEALAEDLVQDVFLRVWRARKTYQPTAKFSTWIFHIANNVASNANRDRGRKREYQTASSSNDSHASLSLEEMAIASTGQIPVRKLDQAERAEVVQVAVKALNHRQRTALILSKFENLSYQEIADTMGLSVKAVKSLLSRARVNLRSLLQPYLDEGQLPQNRSNE
jgi:RNA polymerase sigma-70 factor (ECF subfamily)